MEQKILKFFTSFFIILILFSSGCITQSNKGGAGGVIIESFKTDFNKVYAGEKFQIQMKMRNIGDVDAYNVYPKLYNIQITQKDDLSISCKESCKQGTRLLAPDPERGIEGEERVCIWECTAPENIPGGLSVTFNPSARLYYWYRAYVIKSVNIVSRNELRAIATQGGALSSETVESTKGPLLLDVVVRGPIKYQEEDNKVIFPININIENVGNGVACVTKKITVPIPILGLKTWSPTSFNYVDLISGCEIKENWDKVAIFYGIEDPSIRIYDCEVTEDMMNGRIIDLWKGKTKTITCLVEVGISKETPSILQKNLRFDLEYAYFIDATTSIEVLGKGY